MGISILIDSQLKRILAATRKNDAKLRKTEKTWKKLKQKIRPMKVISVKMRY